MWILGADRLISSVSEIEMEALAVVVLSAMMVILGSAMYVPGGEDNFYGRDRPVDVLKVRNNL